MPRVLFGDLKFTILGACALVLLALQIILPYWVLVLVHIVLWGRHFSSVKIGLAILAPRVDVLICKLSHTISVRPR